MKNYNPLHLGLLAIVDGLIAYSFLRDGDWKGWLLFIAAFVISVFVADFISKQMKWDRKGFGYFAVSLICFVVLGYIGSLILS